MSGREDVFEVVFVCTGNRARSPLAEALFRRHSAGVETAVSSVGTLDLGPVPALPHAIEAGGRLGVDLTDHRARSLHTVALSSADLVLGFEPFHVSAAVANGGAIPDRTFLVRELVLLLGRRTRQADAVSRARATVSGANERRVGFLPDFAAISVADPLGKPAEVMHRTAIEIDGLVRQLVFGLFGEDRSGRPQ